MTQITVCPSCTLEQLIDQEGLHYVLDTIYDLVVDRLGSDMEWNDAFMYNTKGDVDSMFEALAWAARISEGV